MTNIAFLGLGMMGSGMASCLLAAGNSLSVWNRTPDKAGPLEQDGAAVARTPAEAAADAQIIFSMVADDGASERVWLAQDGALSAARPGSVVIECSTISHKHVKRLAQAAGERRCAYIDCPVNGPPSAAANGELILLTGGDQADIDTLVKAVETGPCASPHVVRMIRPMAEGRLADSFGLAIGLREKDTRYCLGMASSVETGMAVGETAYEWYRLALDSVADQDDSAMLSVVSSRNGRPD
jgi:3-hydroxyisobutyrate dehydrogenase-like beta-hydroxyacid dehydrogenase